MDGLPRGFGSVPQLAPPRRRFPSIPAERALYEVWRGNLRSLVNPRYDVRPPEVAPCCTVLGPAPARGSDCLALAALVAIAIFVADTVDAARYRRRRALCRGRAAGDGLRRAQRHPDRRRRLCCSHRAELRHHTRARSRQAAPSCAASSAWWRSPSPALLPRAISGPIEALREHASLLDLTHDTIFVRDQDDVITYWNRAATELYGWRPGAGDRPAKAASFCTPCSRRRSTTIMSELMRTGRWEGELVHTTRDGARLVVASRWALQRDGARPFRRSSRPTTTSPSAAQRRGRPGARRRRAAACRARRHLGELTASIAHEVNQPLAAVVTNGEACLRWLGRDRSRPRPGATARSST